MSNLDVDLRKSSDADRMLISDSSDSDKVLDPSTAPSSQPSTCLPPADKTVSVIPTNFGRINNMHRK